MLEAKFVSGDGHSSFDIAIQTHTVVDIHSVVTFDVYDRTLVVMPAFEEVVYRSYQ